mgnify:CR=1 FL=1
MEKDRVARRVVIATCSHRLPYFGCLLVLVLVLAAATRASNVSRLTAGLWPAKANRPVRLLQVVRRS